jgi:hypothetical protein
MNRNLESWAFLSLMGCLTSVTLSLTVLSGTWATVGSLVAVMLGLLAGGLYGASVQRND